MIKYWPTQPSIKLNNAIVELFVTTSNKIKLNLSNSTNYYLYLDILNIESKYQLFEVILDEFKVLLLDLVELDVNANQFNYVNERILRVFIKKVFSYSEQQLYQLGEETVIFLNKNEISLIKELIVYLMFGSSKVTSHMFSFNPLYTPYNHVQILFENFIISTANIIIQNIVRNLKSSTKIYNFFRHNNKCNSIYTSHRSITLFLNNLKWQNFTEYYFSNTRSLYNKREQVFLLSSRGIISKYIYISNTRKIKCLNKMQGLFLLWLEMKDLIIPKAEKILVQTSKYLIYFLVNFFSNLVIALLRLIIFYLNT